jgi:hypothetical protein
MIGAVDVVTAAELVAARRDAQHELWVWLGLPEPESTQAGRPLDRRPGGRRRRAEARCDREVAMSTTTQIPTTPIPDVGPADLADRPDLIALAEALKHAAAAIADALYELADAVRSARDLSGIPDTPTDAAGRPGASDWL